MQYMYVYMSRYKYKYDEGEGENSLKIVRESILTQALGGEVLVGPQVCHALHSFYMWRIDVSGSYKEGCRASGKHHVQKP